MVAHAYPLCIYRNHTHTHTLCTGTPAASMYDETRSHPLMTHFRSLVNPCFALCGTTQAVSLRMDHQRTLDQLSAAQANIEALTKVAAAAKERAAAAQAAAAAGGGAPASPARKAKPAPEPAAPATPAASGKKGVAAAPAPGQVGLNVLAIAVAIAAILGAILSKVLFA